MLPRCKGGQAPPSRTPPPGRWGSLRLIPSGLPATSATSRKMDSSKDHAVELFFIRRPVGMWATRRVVQAGRRTAAFPQAPPGPRPRAAAPGRGPGHPPPDRGSMEGPGRSGGWRDPMTLRKAPGAPSLARVIATLGPATEDPIEESGWACSFAGWIPLPQMSGCRRPAQPQWDRGRWSTPPVGSRGTDDHAHLEEECNA